jgi:carbohydrate-selective porin OprB
MNRVRNGLWLGATAVACAVSAVSAPAMAQGAGPTAPQPYDSVAAFGQALAKDGIFLNLGYIEDLSSVVAGGQKTGTMPIGHATAGVVFDLQTIMGITGASLHITFDERNGESINGIAGSPSGLLQSDSGPFKTRLGEFFWEQGFDHDRLDITFGRTNPTSDFAFSDLSCSFVGLICAQPTSWYFNNDDVAYPSSSWGARVNFAVTPDVYARAGVYQHDSTAGNFGNVGFNWNWEHSQGAFIPVEIGYQTSFRNAQYPAKYNVGFYEDTASYTQANGQLGARNAFWAQFQQVVWRPDRATNQSLSVFGGAIVYSGNSPNWGQYYLGLYDRGPFAVRPHDTIGLIGSLFTNNSASRPNKPTQETFELNYGFSVIPGVTLKPYAQYVIAPSNDDSLLGSSQPDNAWIVGVQVALNFSEMFEFPQFIAH